jgi:hypothetical protein
VSDIQLKKHIKMRSTGGGPGYGQKIPPAMRGLLAVSHRAFNLSNIQSGCWIRKAVALSATGGFGRISGWEHLATTLTDQRRSNTTALKKNRKQPSIRWVRLNRRKKGRKSSAVKSVLSSRTSIRRLQTT